MKKLILVFFCAFIISSLASMTTIQHTDNNMKVSQTNPPSYSIKSLNAVYPAINITNNNDLSTRSLIGNGSSINPFIIGNFVISNCSTSIPGIGIQNTDQYFVLTNITAVGCSVGIQFSNVTHGSIVNSYISNTTSFGITFNNTYNSTFINTSVLYCNSGIQILNSSFNTFTDNSLIDNPVDGFSISYSLHNTFFNNTILNSITDNFGFHLDLFSNYNNFTLNKVTMQQGIPFNITLANYNFFESNIGSTGGTYCFALVNTSSNIFDYNEANNCGFSLKITNYSTITNNIITNNPGDGFTIISSGYNLFTNNSITSSSTKSGFHLEYSSNYNNFTINRVTMQQGIPFNVNLSDNNLFVFNYGSTTTSYCFTLLNASYNTLINNKAMTSGYYLIYSDYNNLTGNIALYSFQNFKIDHSNNNFLLNNTVLNNISVIATGFSFVSSSYNNVRSNIVYTLSGTSCYQLVNSNNNTLYNNTAIGCQYGINLQSSNNNSLVTNKVMFNSYGFYLLTSSQNVLITNYGSNNTVADYYDGSHLNNTLLNNIFLSNKTQSNSSSAQLPPGGNSGSGTGTSPQGSGNGINFPKLSLPEITALSLVVLIPLVGIYAYRKLSGNGNKRSFRITDLQTDFNYDKHTPIRLAFLGPILAVLATIYFSNKHKNLDYFDLKSNELRGKILTILEDQHFIHFNKLREILHCGVSILKWHIQVLNEFKIVKWDKIGQYKVIYLVERPPAKKEVNLFYALGGGNGNVIEILNNFQKASTWNINDLVKQTTLRKDSVLYHCNKLVSIHVLRELSPGKVFAITDDSRELVKKLLYKQAVHSSRRR